jgi:pyruvate-ferredoxin/flavodoxin oxidoreductase
MSTRRNITIDGNEAAASVAHRVSEVIAIYPITPSSNMGEWADEWASQGKTNIWGVVPSVVEMQSEGGASGAVHGALQAGSLTTTFTASQGLLLMIPNMYKIAGELTSCVIHVAARTVATHALSIFGDHADVYACRQTGFAMLAAASVQEAHDMAAIAHAATLETRLPFLHYFDGFRTSHEVRRIEELTDDDLRALLSAEAIEAHRARALSPDRPVLRGTAQNPDAFFQAREAASPWYAAAPAKIEAVFERFGKIVGRNYHLFDYHGHPEAERVIVIMGSGAEAVHETVDWMLARGEKVGVLKVRLFRPFVPEKLLAALPKSVRKIAVLDRAKEPGALHDPLALDVMVALTEARSEGRSPFAQEPIVVGGRYGLSSKEFTPSMIKSVYDELSKDRPKNRFTVGINDDVSHSSLAWDPKLDIEPDTILRGVFYGLGSDGTVGANKNSIKIISEEGAGDVQAYFVYDSKKAGATTISHLRYGTGTIRSPYLVRSAQFVACHNATFLEKFDLLELAKEGSTFLLNCPWGADEVWDYLPKELQESMLEKKVRFFVIDADRLAKETGMGRRINTIMQACFFGLSGVMPTEKAIDRIKDAIKKSYGKKDEMVVKRNMDAVDGALAKLAEVKLDGRKATGKPRPPIVSGEAPDLVRTVEAFMLAGQGDLLPVSAFSPDGTWPTGTARWEKRNIALDIPIWDPAICIQCNKCALVCPHAAIRPKVYDPALLEKAPAAFLSMDYKAAEFKGQKYTIQVAPEDCTGCTLCVHVCPAKDKKNPSHKALDMVEQAPIRERERNNWDFFLGLPEVDRTKLKASDVKGSQFMLPLFEFSGACVGCGETPYVKLMTQLFGDRALIANATGCSSIYGANLPTTPYAFNAEGRGPAWSNSLFEDNAEFGLGFRLAVDQTTATAKSALRGLSAQIGDTLVGEILNADQSDETGLGKQRERIVELRKKLASLGTPDAKRLAGIADYLAKKSVWIVGGDGWAYDIGYGGLDHVLAMGRDVNLLVLDTEVYSNTGGQASKATPLGAVARFAMGGKRMGRKDLGMMAMAYGHVYVAQVAFGAKDSQTVKAFAEAESYPGPSIIIAYSHCIAHGFDMAEGLEHQKAIVDSGFWPLYRFDPRRREKGENPLVVDSSKPAGSWGQFVASETRFKILQKADPVAAKALCEQSEKEIAQKLETLDRLAR